MATAYKCRIAPVPRGDFVAGTVYSRLDIVRYGTNSYICRVAASSSRWVDAEWMLLNTDGANNKQGTMRVYTAAAELKADRTLSAGMTAQLLGGSAKGDHYAGIYVIESNTHPPFYKDEDDVLLLSSGVIARKLCSGIVVANTRDAIMQGADEYTEGSILACALSYYLNNDKFYYGNDYVGSNETNVVALGLSGGKYQIDCSSYVDLVTSGVFFDASVYAGNSVNGSAAWGYDWTDRADYYNGTAFNLHRLAANDITYYCHERGYSYKPNSAWSNVKTGDIVSYDNHPDNAMLWNEIGHVALVVGVDDDGVKVIDVGDDVVSYRYMSAQEKAQVTYLARLPLRRGAVTTIAFSDRTEFYAYLSTFWALLCKNQTVKIAFRLEGMTDAVLGGKYLRCEIFKHTERGGWLRFSGYSTGTLPEGEFDILVPIQNEAVTATALQNHDKFLDTLRKVAADGN